MAYLRCELTLNYAYKLFWPLVFYPLVLSPISVRPLLGVLHSHHMEELMQESTPGTSSTLDAEMCSHA